MLELVTGLVLGSLLTAVLFSALSWRNNAELERHLDELEDQVIRYRRRVWELEGRLERTAQETAPVRPPTRSLLSRAFRAVRGGLRRGS